MSVKMPASTAWPRTTDQDARLPPTLWRDLEAGLGSLKVIGDGSSL